MLETSLYAVASVILVSAVSLVGIVAVFWDEKRLRRYTPMLVSIAIGALLGGAFIHLIPESFDVHGDAAGLVILIGILFFFVFEKSLHWHHGHSLDVTDTAISGDEPVPLPGRPRPVGTMLLVSDGIHNFLDGVVIGASYLVGVEVGIATTAAVVLHEIPQEIGDFGVLIHAGYTRAKALFLNFVSALTAVFGVVLVLMFHETANVAVSWVIPLAAGGFIYIALSDLVPELHKFSHLKQSLTQLAVIIFGVALILLLSLFEIDNSHNTPESAGRAIAPKMNLSHSLRGEDLA